MSEQKRRKWTVAEKLRIVLTCMQLGVEVSEICRREGDRPDDPMVQRAAFAQCPGIPSAGGLLPRQARGALRPAAAEVGCRPAPTERKESTTSAAHAATNQRGGRRLT